MQVKLLEAYDLTVHKDGLRKAISAAKKSQKPGYSLCYNLLLLHINIFGGGFSSYGVFFIDYVVVWCKRNGHPTPLESSLNDAITERISYTNQIKMALKKQKN
ncbi:hypothetical protein ACJMK2_036663 [Sinanodonta woodiana]|uniref:Uncharacterized protein n=1 Tax=Sinanodonta woodiana TaxID=1069815 RepID=A0ABD3WM32_SINWO